MIEDELKSITVENLVGHILSPGDVYWIKANKTKVKLINSGQIIDKKFLEKFSDKKNSLQIHYKFSSSQKQREVIENLFFKLKNEQFEMNNVGYVKRILKGIFPTGATEYSFVDLISIGHKCFYEFDDNATDLLVETDVKLFQRSSILSIYAVILSMMSGYFDYKFLKDIYHICYLFDFSFSQDKMSYYQAEALEKERLKGNGRSFLEGKNGEYEEFIKHPETSYKIVKRKFLKFFSNKQLVNIIKIHHEKIDGSGFPSQNNEEDFIDLERILIFLNESLSYEYSCFEKETGIDYLEKSILNGEGQLYLSPRIEKIIKESLEYIKEDENIELLVG